MSEQIKMALNIKDLCRLCAKKNEFSKDLLDKKNKNILKMILEYIEISINDNDDLPSKVCLNCEEKVMSFQLFVVECLKIQETLRRMTLDNGCDDSLVKLEDELNNFGLNLPLIKSEVKVELQNDDLANALHNNELLAGIEEDDLNNDEDSYDSEGDMSDVALATLKEAKLENVVKKSKVLSEEEKNEFKNVLRKPNLSIRDFVKLKCDTCEESIKTWSALWYHYGRVHKTRPYIYCICGFVIRSKSALYKHVSDHKAESRKLRKSESGSDKQYDEKYSNFNVNDFVNFTCVICERQCKSWYTLQSHCERFHKVKPEVRCICGVALKSKSVLYKHVQDHKNPNNICCDKCPRITKSLAVMNKHKLRHVPKSERKFGCSSCDKVFNTKELLKSHVKSHIPIEERKIYRCDICFLKFTTRSSCASHKRIVHDKIKSYVCDLCGYACGTGGELRQHRAIHSEDKPFVCIKCYKSFKTYSNLKTHMDTHEDTSYACHVCNRVLNSRRTLRKHLLVHEDKCQHVCSYCNKAFKRRQTLKVHMHTHTGDKPLSCKWCDERFSYASTLRSHRLRCHPDKMAARYPSYQHTAQEGYLKNDTVPGGMKGDLEAIQ